MVCALTAMEAAMYDAMTAQEAENAEGDLVSRVAERDGDVADVKREV